MKNDPREILLSTPMGTLQIVAVILCVGLNGLDGFDVLSISFASPGIAEEWNIDRARLGIILGAELVGMGFGSVFIGGLADKIGRRPTILGCLVAMTTGMALAAIAIGMYDLLVYRVITGLGIGGMLACINAMTAEYSNAKRRNLAVTIMACGYPIGAIIGGAIVSMLLVNHDWRSVFVFGAIVSAAFLPLIWYLMPESIEFLQHRRPPDALERINHTLKRMGHTTVDSLPERIEEPPKQSITQLFSPKLARTTILLSIAYFMHVMTFYFVLKWIPKIVVDMGFPASSAGGVLVWANVGGVSGSIVLGLLTLRFGVRGLVMGAMVFGSAMVIWFGQAQADLTRLALVAATAGFFTNSAIVGMYAMFAQSFPTELRASGTGFAIGFGRAGAAIAPMVAGFLFAAGWLLPQVAVIMGSGSLVAAVMLYFVIYREPTREIVPDEAL